MPLRFEIEAIRSWTRGRRNKGPGSHSYRTNGARDPELTSLLEAYDERFESVAAAERSDAERHEVFRVEAARLLDTVISPELHEIGKNIAEHGHTWSVESRVDILGQPALACSFMPREVKDRGHGASELSFRFLFPDRLTVAGAAHDGSEMKELPPRSHEVNNLDAELVRSEVTRFVASVLDHS